MITYIYLGPSLLRYHRLLKREKMKEHMKEFETLKEKDPEAALEKLQELEKRRVEERMTLKHKGAGKWAKMQAIRAKYDDTVSPFRRAWGFVIYSQSSLINLFVKFTDKSIRKVLKSTMKLRTFSL